MKVLSDLKLNTTEEDQPVFDAKVPVLFKKMKKIDRKLQRIHLRATEKMLKYGVQGKPVILINRLIKSATATQDKLNHFGFQAV